MYLSGGSIRASGIRTSLLPFEQALSVNRTEVSEVLKLMLPQLAIGWNRQRADVIGF